MIASWFILVGIHMYKLVNNVEQTLFRTGFSWVWACNVTLDLRKRFFLSFEPIESTAYHLNKTDAVLWGGILKYTSNKILSTTYSRKHIISPKIQVEVDWEKNNFSWHGQKFSIFSKVYCDDVYDAIFILVWWSKFL